MSRTDPSTGSVPTRSDSPSGPPVRDWWVVAGMTVAAVSAAVASFSGLYGLASAAGWPKRLAWLLPLTLDAHAMTSARVWLADTTRSAAARRFARANALGAIVASIAGNAAYHAIGTGLLDVTWPIVVLVGAVPAAVLGLTAHLHALRNRVDDEYRAPARAESHAETRQQARTDEPGNEAADHSEEPTGPQRTKRAHKRPRSRTEDELMAAARDADQRYRDTHGRPITRDALRAELRVSGARATELRRRLAHPPEAPAQPGETTPDRADGPSAEPVDTSERREEVMHS